MNKNKEINIEEWEAGVLQEIRQFKEHWKKQSSLDRQIYPERLAEGDWDEQLHFFSSGKTDEYRG